MKPEIIKTEDGSHTLYVSALNEHYHSVHGAVTESMHVFINAGLKACKKENIRLLEVGFGTGLNAWLTYMHQGGKTIEYVALEKYPVESNILDELNYTKYLSQDSHFEHIFHEIHEQPWNITHKLSPAFLLMKIKTDIQTEALTGNFDLIYFDAFAPAVQPEMWSEKIFRKIYERTAKEGILVTYCAKGMVRRTMQNMGYSVECLQGPPGKREMLRAVKT